ncbi:hypothetical protein PILCRDRAFT_830159 [Piloderma croceum F 1598]|uniref:Secreted protein n=1 Tax=Piloderma croceum (strain F 1598) TaxID=765440 RepID=A0A0C3EVB6_PILCF|nr:hypothetical protein PILCRDRAFT_830159 [Piloderma croceum F 1598]
MLWASWLGILWGMLKTCSVVLWTNLHISAAVDPLKQGVTVYCTVTLQSRAAMRPAADRRFRSDVYG